ncbi:TonB-dependent receptor plug domain-containing protein [Anthocerotibacter panamensis]|uniref:TonB-dependent receptor plug domain-containing protein n=1 Tax=Anthocerotibacter panamensis TaxID=2857077 RepID=UPI001C407039|nr:TonB-dependent receptor [Anthocerotibacter panamensis]
MIAALGMGVARAEDVPTIAQASALTPTAGQAKDLLGAAVPVTQPNQSGALITAQQPAPTAPTAAATDDEDNEPVDLLGEFNVTAQRRRTTERENTQTTFVVGKEDIRAQGATTIGDALRLVPGFTLVDSLSGIDNRGQNNLRGLDDSRFIILQDGRPLTRASNNRASDISKLPTVNVERIEVVTGGATLRYGADAVAGAINVITRVPEGPPKFSASYQTGSFGFNQYTASFSGSTGDLNIPGNFAYDLLYERRAANNDYPYNFSVSTARNGGAFIDPNFSRDPANYVQSINYQGAFQGGLYAYSDFYAGKFIFKPGKDHTITVYAQQQNTRRGFNTFGAVFARTAPLNADGSPNPAGNFIYSYDPLYYYSRINYGENPEDETGINLTWDWNLSALSTLSVQADLKSTYAFNPPAGTNGQAFFNNRTIETQVRYVSELYPGNTLNAGFQFITNRSVQSPVLGQPVNDPSFSRPAFDRERGQWALYLTEDLKFFDDALIVNAGTRYTVDNVFGNFFTSGAGARYNFGGEKGREIFGLRVNWSESFKSPGLSQLFAFFQPSPTAQSLPNPNLRPERGSGYDIGLDVAISPTALFRATYYRIDLTQALSEGGILVNSIPIILPNGNPAVLRQTQSVNLQAVQSSGFDFSFQWQATPNFKVQLTQSFVDSRPVGIAEADQRLLADGTVSPVLSRGQLYGIQRTDIPFNTSGLLLQYNSPAFNAAISGIYVGQRIQVLNVFSPSYAKFDFTFDVPITPNVTFKGAILNFTNTNYNVFGLGFQAPPIQFRGGVELTF